MRRHRTGQGARFTSPAIGEDKRTAREDEERSLLNASSDMLGNAVGLPLNESDRVAQKVQAAAVRLAVAIVSRDPGAIGKNGKAVFGAATA